LAVNGPNYGRLHVTFGSPLGVTAEPQDMYFPEATYRLDVQGPSTLISSLMKNLSVHQILPWSAPETVETRVRSLHAVIGEDPDRVGTNLSLKHGFKLKGFRWNDANFAGNPFFLLLLLIAMMFAIWRRLRPNARHLEPVEPPDLSSVLMLLLFATFVLYCSFLNWQPYTSRLQLPLFVAAAVPMTRWLVRHLASPSRWWLAALALLLCAQAIPYLIYNNKHKAVGMDANSLSLFERSYYLEDSQVKQSYNAISQKLLSSECRDVGVVSGRDEAEYLLWLPNMQAKADMRIEHIDVRNRSKNHVSSMVPFRPCAIVYLLLAGEQSFRVEWVTGGKEAE
jgi:hypothetical protein